MRPIEQAVIWARNPGKAEALVQHMSKELDIAVSASSDLAGAVKTADIVVTTTPSTEPLVLAEWLQPGQHVTCMGSDQSHKNELHADCLARADCYVPDRRSQTEKLGELHHALIAGSIDQRTVFPELGEIITKRAAGRASQEAITICDLTGTGVQDTAIANLASQRAESCSVGTSFRN